MGHGPGPSIGADAARRALTGEQGKAADRETTHQERATLDEEELRELERAEYYDAPAPEPAPPPTPPVRRSLLERLLRRSG